ncbi:hypothetical protein RB653_007133 [Dictyostelium firmibasis]|uniref:Bacterial surface antigen (D15) domain-containing protein n=1 Tax=Dictyostelium firmibasis TaxID=79012 RepID=A0AAN7TU28_9MYCE
MENDQIKIKFENINSKDEFLLETYFKGFEKLKRRDWNNALESILILMEKENVVSGGDYEIDNRTDEITIKSKDRGISIGVSVNTDKTTSGKFDLSNPFGKGGLIGFELNAGMYKNFNGSMIFTDRFANRLSLTKSTQEPIIEDKNFKIDETSLSYSFQKNLHKFSIFSSDGHVSVLPINTNKEHLASTGTSYKTGFSHIFSLNKNGETFSQYFKIHSEIALPIVSSCSFLKSILTYSLDYPLYKGLRLKSSFITGGIFNFTKNSMIPLSQRFFNGRDYNFEGYIDSSLTEKGKSPYLGGNFFFTFRTSLLHQLKDNVNVMVYHCIGNTVLPLGNNNTFKSTALNLFSPNSLRSSVGIGLSLDMGPVDVECSIVKPLSFNSQDNTNNFAMGVSVKA